MNKKTLYDIIERAVWTFAQTFIAVYTFGGTAELKSAAVAGAASALSVIKTTTKNLYDQKYGAK